MKQTASVAILLLCVITSNAQSLRQGADSIRKYRNIPGLSYAVFNSSGILDSGATGLKKAGVRIPVSIHNKFPIGTSTASFTAFLAAKLVEQKKISWKSTLIQVLPELNGKIMKWYHSITLQQLLNQRSGIQPYSNDSNYRKTRSLQGNSRQQRLQLSIQLLQQEPLIIKDSNEVLFSAGAVIIAGCMLEKAANKNWEDLVQQHIAKPLQLNIGFGFPLLTDSTQPAGHWVRDGILYKGPANYYDVYYPVLTPALGIYLSLNDYARFVQELLKAELGLAAFISAADARQILYATPPYAMGWSNGNWRGLQVANWLGTSDLYTSYMEVIHDKDIGIVILCNNGSAGGQGGVLSLARFLREYYTR